MKGKSKKKMNAVNNLDTNTFQFASLAWVVEEQEKRKHRTPKVAMGPCQGVTPQDVVHTVQQWVGKKPRGIIAKGEGMHIIELGAKFRSRLFWRQ
jgi:hypothetical protein